MKAVHIISSLFILLSAAKADDAVSVGKFKRLTYEEQVKVFAQAPPDVKVALQPILLHSALLHDFGGEEGLKSAKESQRIGARGLQSLVLLFDLQWRLCDLYMGQIVNANQLAGMPHDKQLQIANELDAKCRDPMEKRNPVILHLVFTLASSPEISELTKKAQTISDRINGDLHFGESHPSTITKKEFDEVNKEVENVYDLLKKLPTLSQEQIQKEYDAIPDEKVHVNMGW